MAKTDHSQGLVTLGRRTSAPASTASSASPGSAGTLYLETYGCQMNVADSDLLRGLLGDTGYQVSTDPTDADVIVINTCAVREKAEERVYARAQELAAHKRGRDVVLAVVGCMAEHLKSRIAERAPHVDVIAGPDSYRRFPELLDNARAADSAVLDVKLDKSETYAGVDPATTDGAVSGFVTVQRGCDKFCTFCVVPFTRGRERGVAPREVLRQAHAMADAGKREVTLLGQTVNSYRYDDVSFAQLLRAVADIDGIERIRFTSPYPVDFSTELIRTIGECDKVCGYVHLPLQSGSDVVLERMRRGYTVADFVAIVKELRDVVPDIAISTDILSGFSGETEADHQMTLELMAELSFDSAFMFSYSERDLTYAAKNLPDDIDPADKKRRLAEIIALQESISRRVFAAQVGKTERVLFHDHSKRSRDQLVGRTDGFKSVIVPKGDLSIGDTALVRIERATMATLFGTPVA